MICYGNNGQSFRTVDKDYIVQDGEVLFADYATTDQLKSAFAGYTTVLKQQQYAVINTTYSAKLDNIVTAIQQSTARGDSATVAKLQATYATTQNDWKVKLKAVV